MGTPEILHPAIRQYRHNNNDDFVCGFDAKITEKIVKQLQREIESLRETVGSLTMQLDKQFGTPCEQVRHAEEIESLRQLQEDQESSMQHEITKLPEERDELRQLVETCNKNMKLVNDERDELREQIKEQDQAYSDLSQLCNLKIGELSAVLQKASEYDHERYEWKKLCFLMMMTGDRTTADLYNKHVDADGNLKAGRDG